MLRTYELLEFVQKFLRKIELALKKIGMPFIMNYCLEKYGTLGGKQKGKADHGKNDIVQIQCFKAKAVIEAANIQLIDHKDTPMNQTASTMRKTGSIDGGYVTPDEDCNLSDGEEEKTQTHHSTQKKAFLSIDKILNTIKKDDI